MDKILNHIKNFSKYKIVILSIIFVISLNAKPTEFYVAKNGNDSNNGSISFPFKNISQALNLVNQKRLLGDTSKVIINIREGYYEITETIELDKNCDNLIIQSFEEEQVILSGGKSLDVNLVQKVSGTKYERIFKKEYANSIYFIDLKLAGIYDYGNMKNVGFSRPYSPSWMELFVNNEPCNLARWPNDSTILIGEVLDPGSIPRNGDHSNRGARFTFPTKIENDWDYSNDIWISGYFRYGYAEDAVKLEEIDTEKNIIKTIQPHLYGFASGKPWNRWYAYNIPEEIDKVNEYYIDRMNGIVFFYSSEEINSVEVSILDEPIIAIENTKNVEISNLIFQSTRGMAIYLENTVDCLVTNCTFRNIGSLAVCIGKGIVPSKNFVHEGLGKDTSRVLGSVQQHRYAETTFNGKGGKNNGIVNCLIYNTGAGGVYLSGGDRISLEPAGNYIHNSIIHDFNRIEKSYRAAVDISGVGNRISNCEIYNAPSMAVLLNGNDHIIEYNNIYDVCLDIDDQGAIYYGRNPSERGNIVRYNYLHHLGGEHNTVAVYHDDGACGMDVIGNIFFKAGSMPVLLGGGSDNTYKNNLFVDSPLAIHIDNRLQNWASFMLDSTGIFSERMNAVNYLEPPYSEKYSHIKNYWDETPSIPKRNVVDQNIFVNITKLIDGDKNNLDWGNDNVIIENYSGYDKFNSESRLFIPYDSLPQLPLGWTPIDVDLIGIKNNFLNN